MASSDTIDLIQLGAMGLPLKIVLENLDLHEKIKLASTNQMLKSYCFLEDRNLRILEQTKKFDLQVFPDSITENIIKTVYRVFPDIIKITARLSNVEDGFLDNLRIFASLKKLSVYLSVNDTIVNRHGINLQQVTIKNEFYNFRTKDVIYSLLWQIRGTKRISIYNGQLDRRLVYLISTRNLDTLKIQSCMITNPMHLTNAILDLTQLKYLKLITGSFLIAPGASHVMSYVINHMITHRNMNIERLVFTLDPNPIIRYSNLRFLKYLRNLTILYTVQNNGVSLEKLIYYAASLRQVNVTFIEFIEKYRIFNESILQANERRSYYYKNIIESMDNYMSVITINYDLLRHQFNFRN